MSVEKIEQDDVLLGIHIYGKTDDTETNFFTDESRPLQLGVFVHDEEYDEPLHTHKRIQRSIDRTHQVIFLREGKMEVEFRLNHTHVATKVVEEGDTILLGDGSHSITALEPVEGVTVKQGPYLGEDRDVEWIENGTGD